MRSRLKIALKNLNRRKLRVFLTSFGVSIGAMAVVILVSFGAGLQKDLSEQLKTFTQVEEIRVSGVQNQAFSFQMGPSFEKPEEKSLNDQVIAELSKIENVRSVFPQISFSGEVTYEKKIGQFYGESISPLEMVKPDLKKKVKFGRFFENDTESALIIPYGLATALGFENPSDIIGKEVTLNNLGGAQGTAGTREFKMNVVGVQDKEEKFAFQVYIPQSKAVEIHKSIQEEELKKESPALYRELIVRAKNAASVGEIKKTIDDKGYGTTSYEDIAKQFNRSFLIMQIVLGVIGSIALLVASLGIVNTMLMSILERTREIGVMKAIGARPRDIRSIFLTEAFLIGFIGGLVGLLLGYGGTKVITTAVNFYLTSKDADGQGLSFYIPLYLSFGVVLFSSLVSSLAGWLPALRAAKLDPVVALRDE